MFFTKDDQTLYLNNWEYNAVGILSYLRKIIIDNGGVVRPAKHSGCSVVNRSIMEELHKERGFLDTLYQLELKTKENREKITEAIERTEEKIKNLSSLPEMRIYVDSDFLSSIYFVLDGVYYAYEMDENPFFEFYYRKTRLTASGASRDACSENDPKEWLFDCFFKRDCSEADKKEAANMIYNFLVSAPLSAVRVDSRRVRVSNTYNSGYHYETIKEKERFEKIAWYEGV